MHWSLSKWWESTGSSRILVVKNSLWTRKCELWYCHENHIMKWRGLCAHGKPANERDNARKRRKEEIVSLRIRGRSCQGTTSYPEKLISLFFLSTLGFQWGQNLNPLSKLPFVCWLSVFSVLGFCRSHVATFTFAFVTRCCTWDVLKGKRRCVLVQNFNTSKLEVQQCHTLHCTGARWQLEHSGIYRQWICCM